MRIEEARIGMEVEAKVIGKIKSIVTTTDGTTAVVQYGGIWDTASFKLECLTLLEEPKNG